MAWARSEHVQRLMRQDTKQGCINCLEYCLPYFTSCVDSNNHCLVSEVTLVFFINATL